MKKKKYSATCYLTCTKAISIEIIGYYKIEKLLKAKSHDCTFSYKGVCAQFFFCVWRDRCFYFTRHYPDLTEDSWEFPIVLFSLQKRN